MKSELLVLVAILGAGISSFFYKLANEHIHPIVVSSIITLIYVCITPLAYLSFKFDTTISTIGIVYCVLGALTAAAGSICFFFALKSGNAGMITTMTSLYPCITIILSRIFLGETVNLKQGFGIALALAGILCISWK